MNEISCVVMMKMVSDPIFYDGLNQRFPKLSQGSIRAYQDYLNMSVLT